MEVLKVTTEALVNQASQVRSAKADLNDCFDRIQAQINGTANYWKGEAAEAHREGYAKHMGKIEEILSRYEEHIRDLEKIAGVYVEAERQAAQQADQLVPSTL